MNAWKVACAILIVLALGQSVCVLGNGVIQETSCDKVLRQEPIYALAKKGEISDSKLGYEVCAQVCGFWSCTTYYCPGDGICCTPGDPESKCCPADHPLCLPEGCCPDGYPKVCGRYCCKEDSYCCNEENCCKIEEACCGEEQCCLEESPCCEYAESKTCCDKNTMACCDGYGCSNPCESQFDAIGCQLSDLSLDGKLTDASGPGPKGRKLYRILRRDEKPKKGIVAKNPAAKKTVLSHVNCGSRPKYASQFISTTTSLEVAKHYKQEGEKKNLTGLRIAEIDLDDLPENCKLETVDLTSEENRDKYLGNAVCKNFAKASCEVLLECDVPIPCKVIDPLEPITKEKFLKDSGEL